MSDDAGARPVWAEIDVGAITHNIGLIRQCAGRPVKLIVPVKANAYGHGAVVVARHLEAIGVDAVATANFHEAVELRAAGVQMPIVMYASHVPEATSRLLEYGLTPTITNRVGLDAAAAASKGGPIDVHVEIDAGLGRLGVRFDEASDFIDAVVAEPRLRLEGLYTHVPFSDAEGACWASGRVRAFGELVHHIEARHGLRIPYTQACASAALMESVPDDLTTVAPGHLTYGMSPLDAVDAEALGFRPALSALRARVIHLGRRETGDVLATGVAPRPVRTAVLLLGIDNGYDFAHGASVLLGGRRCPVVSVTAEYTVVDITEANTTTIGDVATIIGRDTDEVISVGEVASLRCRSAGYWMMGLRRVPLTPM